MKNKRKEIKVSTQKMLWGMNAGRCARCNTPVYEDPLSHKTLLSGEIAHNTPASNNGPRKAKQTVGETKQIMEGDNNDISNLLLLCPSCHKEVDSKTSIYTEEVLRRMKIQHEKRISYLTSIKEDRECLLVKFFAPIGKNHIDINENEIDEAMVHAKLYSSNDHQKDLSTSVKELKDGKATELVKKEMTEKYNEIVKPALPDMTVAIFTLAPIPLMIHLGTLFPTGTKLHIFQKYRNRKGNSWNLPVSEEDKESFEIIKPEKVNIDNHVALALETTDIISNERILSAFKTTDVDIWRIRKKNPSYDIECSHSVLQAWSKMILELNNELRNTYKCKPLHVFPAINNAFAVEFGVSRVEKTDPKWIIYDNRDGAFKKSLTISTKRSNA